jgi:ABC-type bacteriocin/lantibiotic exporter with double-glycine peptidase domain
MPRKKRPPAAPILRVVPQRESSDCSVACLTMLSGETYEDVLRAVCAVDENGARDGMYIPQIIRAASELGMELRKKRRVNLETDQGILHIRFKDGGLHVVMLIAGGYIVDTDGAIWKVSEFMRAYRPRVNAVLVDAA